MNSIDADIIPTQENLDRTGLQHLEIHNEHISLTVNPDFGGKIISIKNKEDGTEFLKQSSTNLRQLTAAEYRSDFLPPYAFGFDECFPTVSPCTIDTAKGKISLPDHGELWSKKWSVSKHENALEAKAQGDKIDYILSKKITLHKNLVLITYNLLNNEDEGFEYLWSSHPLLDIEEGDEILLPDEVDEVNIHYSTDKQFEKGAKSKWPIAINQDLYSNIVPSSNSNFASKVFLKNLATKKAGLYKHHQDLSIIFDFTYSSIKNLGLWMTYGGWPENSPSKDYTIALEPTTSGTDCLKEAIETNSAKYVHSGETVSWSLKILIEKGYSKF